MEYFFMTNRQKRFLEKTFKCLGIGVEDLCQVKNVKTLKEENEMLKARCDLLERSCIESNKAVVVISRQLEELTNKLNEMNPNELMAYLNELSNSMQNEEMWNK